MWAAEGVISSNAAFLSIFGLSVIYCSQQASVGWQFQDFCLAEANANNDDVCPPS